MVPASFPGKYCYLNRANFRVDKCSRFSRILLKFAKLNLREIFDNRRFAKMNPRENFGNGKFANYAELKFLVSKSICPRDTFVRM